MSTINPNERGEVIVKIDGAGGKIWRESGYDFWNDKDNNNNYNNDVATSATSSCSNNNNSDEDFDLVHSKRQQEDSGEFSLEIDLEMAETSTNPKRVSFAGSTGSSDSKKKRRYRDSPNNNKQEGEILRCTSNASFTRETSFNRKSSLLTPKAKSRLLDPSTPEKSEQKQERTPRSGQMKSGFVMKPNDEDEDDPLLEEDIPEEYKIAKVDIWTLLQWISLFLIVSALVCSVSSPYFKHRKWWKLQLWKWEILVLVLICGRLVSGWIIRIIVFFMERNFLLRKRVLYFVYRLRKAVQNCLWLCLVLIAWHYLKIYETVERETKSKTLRFVTKVLVCLLIGTLLWLVKSLLIKVLASSFHVSTYFDRVQESLFNQYVIETLSGPPLVEIRKTEEEEERIMAELPPKLSPRSGRVIGSGGVQRKSAKLSRTVSKTGGITIDHLHKLNPKTISAWNMKRLINIVQYGTLSTLGEQIRDSTHSTHEDESTTLIRSENEAKAAARKIFENVANKPGSKFIYLDDLICFLQEDEALKAMGLFEGASESKRISKSSLKNWLVHAFRERRALALTLNDTKSAVNKLHRFVNILFGIIIVIIWLIILGIATTKFLLFVSSQFVVVAFIFGNTCKTIFESIIFLFVMHPFDVGDRCEIEGKELVVEEMNILTTVFLRDDNIKVVYPNSVLLTKSICNFYRSPDMGDAVEFCVHIATPAEKVAAIKQRITSYIEKKKDHWYPAPMIIMKDVEDLNRLRIAVWLQHKMNHQDMGEKWLRRSMLVEEMVMIFRELDIQFRLLPIDINVRTMPPVNSRHLSPSWTARQLNRNGNFPCKIEDPSRLV